MVELGQLEGRHEDFAKRNTRVVVSSIEGLVDSKKTQDQFPHLIVVSDEERKLTKVADVIHPHSAPGGGDTSAPATLLLDRQGKVVWEHRTDSIFNRLPVDELLAAIDKHVPVGK
jgi:peroxiredoxin